MKLIAAMTFLILTQGCCAKIEPAPPSLDIRDRAVNACIATGGVPVLGFWSGQLKDCKYPPK